MGVYQRDLSSDLDSYPFTHPHTFSNVNFYANPHPNSHPDQNPLSHADTDPDTDPQPHENPFPHPHAHADIHQNPYENAYRHSDVNTLSLLNAHLFHHTDPITHSHQHPHPSRRLLQSLAPDYTPPRGPRCLRAYEGDGAVRLTWSPAADPNGIAGYYVYRSESRFQRMTLVSPLILETEFLDTSVANGRVWSYAVVAVDRCYQRS